MASFLFSIGKTSTTGLVESITQPGGNFTYEYDDNGNIISVVQDGKTTTYEYDALGQLIRVDDEQEGATWEYTYDQGGNILSKTKHVEGKSDETTAFSYTNPNWKDQLKFVNGVELHYDDIGNLTNDGTWTYEWEKGRQLKRMQSVDTDASFVYNENGLRVQKTVNGVVTNYILHGKNIVHMTRGNDTLHFFYDASGKPAIVEYNGVKYAYVQNLQGDIVAILDSTGAVVVSYVYDAWGRPIKKEGSLAETLGTVQPFRYRGYVYDEETELYYLRSRFFNSDYCRFTNADMRLGGSMNHTCHNVYTYCGNNPINYNDPDGQEAGVGILGQMGTAAGTGFGAALAAALAEPSFFGELLLGMALLSGMLALSSSTTMDDVDTDTDTDSRRKNEQKTYIYRRASGTFQSMTPRPGKDSNGLSFFTDKPEFGKYFRTSIESVNATGVLMAVPDPKNPKHILVLPVVINTHVDWMNSRENANKNPHPYTVLLMSLGE